MLNLEEARILQKERQRESVMTFIIALIITAIICIFMYIFMFINASKSSYLSLIVVYLLSSLFLVKQTKLYKLLDKKEVAGRITKISYKHKTKRRFPREKDPKVAEFLKNRIEIKITIQSEKKKYKRKFLIGNYDKEALTEGDKVAFLRFVNEPVVLD